MDDLLRSISWHAEKQVRQRGAFPSVLWLTEDADGNRKLFDTPCVNAPSTATDDELLDGLATDFAIDLSEAPTRVVRLACAYLCRRVITLRPADPNSSTKPTTTKRQGVAIELHGDTEPMGLFREILRSTGGKAILGPAETLAGPFDRRLYAGVLERAHKWRDADAKAKAEVTAQVAAQVAPKAKAKVAAREPGPIWPPQFLLRPPVTPSIRPALSRARTGAVP